MLDSVFLRVACLATSRNNRALGHFVFACANCLHFNLACVCKPAIDLHLHHCIGSYYIGKPFAFRNCNFRKYVLLYGRVLVLFFFFKFPAPMPRQSLRSPESGSLLSILSSYGRHFSFCWLCYWELLHLTLPCYQLRYKLCISHATMKESWDMAW